MTSTPTAPHTTPTLDVLHTLDVLANALAAAGVPELSAALQAPAPPAALRDAVLAVQRHGAALLDREERRLVAWIGVLRLADAALILLAPDVQPEHREVAERLYAYGAAALAHAAAAPDAPEEFARTRADLATAVLAAHDVARRSTMPPSARAGTPG